MSRQTTRLPFRLERNFRFSLLRWVFFMTNMMSAHSICSADNNTTTPFETPAESVSMPGQVEKTCSAVGLRRRLALQTKRTLVSLSPACGDEERCRHLRTEPEAAIPAEGRSVTRRWNLPLCH